jgi:cystathionine beta-lyase
LDRHDQNQQNRSLEPAAEAGDAAGCRRPRSRRQPRLRQSAGLPRIDGALSECRRLPRPASRYVYGRRGTPTSEALEDALRELEGPACAGVALLPSGLAAISTALLAILQAGDHVLITDSVYQPTRKFCNGVLARYGVTTTYYDPMIGAGIAALMQPNTRAVFVEAPGSLSFEVQDIPAIAEAAHARGALVLMDNTWASPLYFRAFEKGVDLSIQAATKYICGHSDAMLGTVSTNAATFGRLRDTVHALGLCVGRTTSISACAAAHHGRAARSASPVRAEDRAHGSRRVPRSRACCTRRSRLPGHAIWKRDFTGASGLFSVVLKPAAQSAVNAFLDELRPVRNRRVLGRIREPCHSVRLHELPHRDRMDAGRPDRALPYRLEDLDDLIGDLERGFAALAAAR